MMNENIDVTLSTLNGWLEATSEELSKEDLLKIFLWLETIIHLIGNEICTQELTTLCMIYANRFVNNYQKLENSSQVLNLLLISLLVSIKFWDDKSPDMDEVALLYKIPKRDISHLERKFLKTLDYSLFLNIRELPKTFLSEMRTCEEYQLASQSQ